MTPRTLGILVVLGILAVGGGWYFGTATNPVSQAEMDSGKLMFPNLAPKLKDAAKIEISSQGKKLVIERKNDIWGVTERSGYPVLETKLRGMLTALTELRLVEPRTADPEQFSRLGLENVDAKDAKSSLLRVLDGSGKPILAVLVGHRRVRTQAKVPEQVYVRRPGETQTWLAEGNLTADADLQLWLDRDVLNIDAKKIAAATATRDGHTIAFARKDDKLVMTRPVDHPPLDEYRVDDVARALEFLTFQDVQPDSAKVGEELGQGDFTTTDGLTIHATVFKGDKDILARFTVSGDDKAKAAAAKLDARLKGWTYQLGSWKEKALVPTLDDLKKAPEKPAAAAPAAAAPAAMPPPVSATTQMPSVPPASPVDTKTPEAKDATPAPSAAGEKAKP